MQVKASTINIVSPDGTPKVFTDVQVLMSEWGIYIKEDENSLLLVTWEKVHSIEWSDVKMIQRVWAEAVLDTLEDMMEFDEDFDLEGEDEEPVKGDDPEVDPYKTE